MAHSAEEEVARNFLCFSKPDAVVVVCDATCLERNLNLVLQILEITNKVIVCVNLLDEAKRKHIHIDLQGLSQSLGVPVIGIVARKKNSPKRLLDQLDIFPFDNPLGDPFVIPYDKPIEHAIAVLEPILENKIGSQISPRWLSLKLMEQDVSLLKEINSFYNRNILADPEIFSALNKVQMILKENGIEVSHFKDHIVSSIVLFAEKISRHIVQNAENQAHTNLDRKLDRIFTSKWSGYPIMLLLLALIFWITITGANYPSQLLSTGLFYLQDRLMEFFTAIGSPIWLKEMLVLGIYRVLAWVVSVMLPPMAIFFPLFTLLEDSGYLPRVAYNLDRPFQCCHACGKQALTMCMGLGCNAAGIVGCRIIDSPRERLIAIITNNFVPCNGRFPTMITILTIFFLATSSHFLNSFLSAFYLTAIIVLGIFMTFLQSKLLSKTILKGVPSSFTLELPPYRVPEIGKVIVRSILDRTLFVLARAACVAAPAGLVIWILANVTAGDTTLLNLCAEFLDPFGKILGLDGVILLSFILGLPANEIVLPIMLMTYMAQGSLTDMSNYMELKQILIQNGWTSITAICMLLFSLMHWPCSTTLLTIQKETKSIKWTLVSFLVPTITGISVCFLVSHVLRIFL